MPTLTLTASGAELAGAELPELAGALELPEEAGAVLPDDWDASFEPHAARPNARTRTSKTAITFFMFFLS